MSCGNPYLSDTLLTTCYELACTMRPHYGPDTLLDKTLFDPIDACIDYLEGVKGMHDLAARLLEGLLTNDARQFPAHHRLGECYSNWFQEALRDGQTGVPDIMVLAECARALYQRSIQVCARVFQSRSVPEPYAKYSFRETEYKTQHSWGTLESKVGEAFREDPTRARLCFLRSAFLLLQSFEPGNAEVVAKAAGSLAETLYKLGRLELAGRAIAACEACGGSTEICRRWTARLRGAGQAVPKGGGNSSIPCLRNWSEGNCSASGRTSIYSAHSASIARLCRRSWKGARGWSLGRRRSERPERSWVAVWQRRRSRWGTGGNRRGRPAGIPGSSLHSRHTI